MAFRPQTAGPLNELVDILVACVKRDFERADISEKLKALLVIAGKTAKGGKQVESADIERARLHGATDLEMHDTVLIAAVFCLCNRYVSKRMRISFVVCAALVSGASSLFFMPPYTSAHGASALAINETSLAI
jgi:hypothetical protein